MNWSEKEVEKAAKILATAEKNKGMRLRLLDETVHWILLIVALLGNFLLAIFLVLFAHVLGAYAYALAALLGLGFGWLVEMPIRDLEKLDKHKHFLSRVLLPLLALVNVYLIIGVKRVAEASLGALAFDGMWLGLAYGAAFLVPHLLSHLKRNA